MKVSLFYLPRVGNRAQIEAALAGLRGDLYQQMLREVSEQVRLADDLGFDSISFTEHRFHIEGFEVSNNPILPDLCRCYPYNSLVPHAVPMQTLERFWMHVMPRVG